MALVGTVGAINNGWARLFMASLADKTNYKTTYLIILTVQITSLILILQVNNM